jgi:L-amino acid N-acyltransferase YncA
MLVIRKATTADLPAITAIYNEAVLTTDATFDNQPKTEAEQSVWFRAHDERHPILVAEKEWAVVGWASLSEWSSRCAYANTAELSIYVREACRGQGIGGKLFAELLSAGRQCGLHTVLSRITEGNNTSIHLHEAAGFKTIGTMREVGYKFDRLLDVRIMQLIFDGAQKV